MGTSLKSLEAVFYISNVPVQSHQLQSLSSTVDHYTVALEDHLGRRYRRQPCHAVRKCHKLDARHRIESYDLCIVRKQSGFCDVWRFVELALTPAAAGYSSMAKKW
jgi:hypothetical protein